MKKWAWGGAALLLTLVLAVAAGLLWISGGKPPLPPHQVFLDAVVLTMDGGNTVAEAVSVRGDRIEAVGRTGDIEALIDGDTVVHRLDGKTLIPGFIDAHGHFPGSGLSELGADLNSPPIGGVRSIDELQQVLRRHIDAHPERHWVFGFGYDDTLLAEHRHPTRAELDAVAGDRPLVLLHISGHMAMANSQALAEAGITARTPDPEGGVIVRDPASGEPTGLLQEHATTPVLILAMDFSAGDFLQMIDAAAAEYLAQGVTTAQSGGVDINMLRGLYLASRLGRIPQRLEIWPMAETLGPAVLSGELDPDDYQRPEFHVGAIKLMADGSIQGFTGHLHDPYYTPYEGDAEYRGYPRMDEAALKEQMLAYHRAGLQVAIHGNGDEAIESIIAAYRYAQAQYPREDARPIIVHAQMAREDQLDAMVELGMTPSFFSAHTYYWGDRHRDIFMGPERAARMSPTRSALERGLRFSVHLDTPVVPMDPLLLLWSTVQRVSASGAEIGPEQRIGVMEALRAMTIDAAWQIHREHELGSIEAGKLADLVVLSDDPRRQPERIRELKVEQVVIGGRKWFDRDDR